MCVCRECRCMYRICELVCIGHVYIGSVCMGYVCMCAFMFLAIPFRLSLLLGSPRSLPLESPGH